MEVQLWGVATLPSKCHPLLSNRHIRAMVIIWRVRGKIIRFFGAILCATIVQSAMHTHMNTSNSSLDWVLSHWAHFTVLRFIFVYVLIFCVSLYCMHV